MSVREGLLALLAAGPKHGYQLRQEFESATAGIWPLNIGQVYTTLERLQRDGLVEEVTADDSSDRRRFRLTVDGRADLRDWLSSGPDPAPAREPTMIKVLVAMHTDGVDVRQVIDVQRQALLTHLAEQQRARRKAAADAREVGAREVGAREVGAREVGARAAGDDVEPDVTTLMMFDALVTRTEADLRWLDLCDEHLARRPTSRKDPR